MELNDNKLSHSPQSSVYNRSTSPTAQLPRRTSRPGTRVSHSKSRKGCVTCKRKKVKCDEQRPSCFNCTRLQVECRYLLVPLKKSPIAPKEFPKAIPDSINGINFVDLELLYVYTTSTYSTLSTSSILRQFWRITVPQLAIQNRYLMGEVLALAALHLAYYRSAQRNYYLSIALNHHQAASQKAMELLENVTKENSDGLFVFSLLTLVTSIVPKLSRLARFHRLIFLAMATPKRSSSNDIPTEEGDFEDWIYLIQGTKELRGTLGEECSSSPLAPLFTCGSERWNLHYSMHSATGRCNDMLLELQTRMRTSVHDLDKLDIYNERISSLQSAASHAFDWEGTDVFFWLYGCIDGFLPLVKARNQEAWVILAYFSVMLKKAEAQWWLQGWADCIMRKIYEQLDGEHKHWIARAIEEIGWIA